MTFGVLVLAGLFAATFLLAGCGEAGQRASPEARTAPGPTKPSAAREEERQETADRYYEVGPVVPGTTAYDGPQAQVAIFTNAPEGDLQGMADEVYADLQQYDMPMALFYPLGAEEPWANLRGVRYAFRNPEVEQRFYEDLRCAAGDISPELCADWTAEN